MKKFNIFLISCFLLLCLNPPLFSLDNDSEGSIVHNDNDGRGYYRLESLSEIFEPYINLIDKYTDSSTLLKDWRNLEYLQFLNILNLNYRTVKKYYSKNQIIFSTRPKSPSIQLKDSSTTNTIIMGISAELSEIFGGIYLKKHNSTNIDYTSNPNTFFIPEEMLDSRKSLSEYFERTKNVRRHDGVLLEIRGNNVYIYVVYESKFSGNVDIKQAKGVFNRWSKEGILISRKIFKPENIYLLTSSNKFKSITRCDYRDFEKILYYTGLDLRVENSTVKNRYSFLLIKDISEKDLINKNILKNISIDILVSLYDSNISEILEQINTRFIRRILFQLKNYILKYNSIPSLDSKLLNVSFYKKNQRTNNTGIDYDIISIKDLTLSLYLIYHSDILYPVFQREIIDFLTPEEIDTILSLLNKDDFVFINSAFNIDGIINTLTKALGESHRAYIETVVYQNKVFLEKNYKTFIKDFYKKFSYIQSEFISDFSIENIRKLVLDNLDIFIKIKQSKLKEILNYLNESFGPIVLNTVRYKFLDLYLDKLLGIKFSSDLTGIHEFIRQEFMSGDSVGSFEFILNNFESFNNLSLQTLKSNYMYLSEFFSNRDASYIKNLFLSNINTLLYLKQNNFNGIIEYLSNYWGFSYIQIQNIIISNFSKIHTLDLSSVIENIEFVVGYLESIDYKFSAYEIIRNKLYKISYIDKNKAGEILGFLSVFLGKAYKSSLYKWLLEEDERFDEFDIKEIKKVIRFLVKELDDEKLVKETISNLDNLFYLDIELWKIVISRIKLKLKDKKEMIRVLFEKDFLNFNRLFSSLNRLNDNGFNILFNSKENNVSKMFLIDKWIEHKIIIYDENRICTSYFVEEIED